MDPFRPVGDLGLSVGMQGLNTFLSITTNNCRLPKCEHFALVRANHLLGAKRRFRMGLAGWRFANKTKDNKTKHNERVAIIATLEDWAFICSVAVASGAMILLAVMLYDWSGAQ